LEMLACHHVALWVDFRKEDLLGAKTVSIVMKINKLKPDDPWLVETYNTRGAKKELAKHQVKQRLITTLANIPNDKKWNAMTISNNLTPKCKNGCRKNMEKMCISNVPWSPQFQGFFDRIELMKILVRRQGCKRSSSMTKCWQLARITGDWHALKGQPARRATAFGRCAFKQCKETKKKAPEWSRMERRSPGQTR
jgi:hypothetical protein